MTNLIKIITIIMMAEFSILVNKYFLFILDINIEKYTKMKKKKSWMR